VRATVATVPTFWVALVAACQDEEGV
jgi:hypothetical protein